MKNRRREDPSPLPGLLSVHTGDGLARVPEEARGQISGEQVNQLCCLL